MKTNTTSHFRTRTSLTGLDLCAIITTTQQRTMTNNNNNNNGCVHCDQPIASTANTKQQTTNSERQTATGVNFKPGCKQSVYCLLFVVCIAVSCFLLAVFVCCLLFGALFASRFEIHTCLLFDGLCCVWCLVFGVFCLRFGCQRRHVQQTTNSKANRNSTQYINSEQQTSEQQQIG